MLAIFKFLYEDSVCPKHEKEKPGSFNIKGPVGGVYMEEGQPCW